MPLQVKKVQLKLKDGNEYKDGDLLFNVDAEAWVRGTRNGTIVPAPVTPDNNYPHAENNAEYYSEQSARSAEAAANAALTGNLAGIFNSAINYEKGEYVIYGGDPYIAENRTLYRFIADHSAGNWTGTDVQQCSVADELNSIRSDMTYENIKIDLFTVSPTAVEIGTNPQTFTLSWSTSKTPVSITLDGTAVIPTSATSATKSVSDSGTHSKTFTLIVQDAGSATIEPGSVSKNVTAYWYYKVYSGARGIGTINDTFVKSLTGTLLSATKKDTSFTANAAGATDYLWFAAPSAWGTPIFKFGANEVGFINAGTAAVTLPDNSTVNYYVFRSPEAKNGLTTIIVDY